LAFVTDSRARFDDSRAVTVFAPRIDAALLEALVELDDPTVPIAEINRRVGRRAEQLGLRRPSYQRVRELVHESRQAQLRRTGQPTTKAVLLDIIFRARPPSAFVDHISGVGVPRLRP
jgi:hypothetical protein